MFSTIRSFIERHFGLLLITAFIFGLFVPGAENVPKEAILILLATIILFSCSKIKIEDFKAFRLRDILGFYILRFIIFPVIVFYIAGALIPDYRYALLLLALLPCGATLPAMLGILGGNTALGLSAVTVTGLMAPFTITLGFYIFSDVSMDLDIQDMFYKLVLMIFCPAILYFGFLRMIKPVKIKMRENASMMGVLLICVVIVIVVSYEREKFFMEPMMFLEAVVIGFVAYFSFYAMGWILFKNADHPSRISYALMSGNNNIALGISLAALYFPQKEAFILVAWEILWIMGVTLFQLYLKRYPVTQT